MPNWTCKHAKEAREAVCNAPLYLSFPLGGAQMMNKSTRPPVHEAEKPVPKLETILKKSCCIHALII